jgi:CheY-like chemotaxis protein
MIQVNQNYENQTETLTEKKRILLVEDNELNRKIMQVNLERLGYEVTAAVDGEEAVEAVNKHTFHIILMDIQMPRLDGYEATKRIRVMGIQTPIIAVTAFNLDEMVRKCFETGMNDYLIKPIRKKDLIETIAKWLNNT